MSLPPHPPILNAEFECAECPRDTPWSVASESPPPLSVASNRPQPCAELPRVRHAQDAPVHRLWNGRIACSRRRRRDGAWENIRPNRFCLLPGLTFPAPFPPRPLPNPSQTSHRPLVDPPSPPSHPPPHPPNRLCLLAGFYSLRRIALRIARGEDLQDYGPGVTLCPSIPTPTPTPPSPPP